VAFSTRHLNAQAGIMITASHNPKTDAGYKLYWNDGCQIRPPVDEGIQSCILQNLQPWMDYGKLLSSLRTDSMDVCCGLSHPQLTRDVTREYFHAIQTSGLVTGQASLLLLLQTAQHFTPPKFAYTAMHGVGREVAAKVFEIFGLPELFHSVPSQELPDPEFPTVKFPNPEESGALDVAMEFAKQHDCHIVLANDPDADRLAVAERDPTTGEWTVFKGDEIGTMLGYWLWQQVGTSSEKPVAMCASTVSSNMLAEIARVCDFHFEETLTGFKWIGSRAQQMAKEEGYNSLFCYEEAIGFCCGSVVYDKDGISALGVLAELAVYTYSQHKTLAQHMQSLYEKFGEFVSHNGYFLCYDSNIVNKILDDIKNDGAYVDSVGPYEVESIRDLSPPGYDSSTVDRRPTLPTSSSSPMITIRFQNGCVAQFRGSGTEPKFKYYLELKGQPGVPRSVVTSELETMSAVILEELLHPEANGLVLP
jgi:phosphomannomutase